MAKAHGWQWGMWVPGILGLLLGVYTLAVVRDSPEDAGLQRTLPGEEAPGSNGRTPSATAGGSATASTATVIGSAPGGAEARAKTSAAGGDEDSKVEGGSIMAALGQAVSSRGIQLLALTYFFVYVVRQASFNL